MYIHSQAIVKILTVSLDLRCGGERNFNIPKIEDLCFTIKSIFVSRVNRRYTVKLIGHSYRIISIRKCNVYAHYSDTLTHREIGNLTKIIQKRTCST